MMTTNEDDRCQTCGQTFGWHQANPQTRHPFNDGQDGATDFLKRRGGRDPKRDRSSDQGASETPLIAGFAHDAVLRIALINRGILTPADLVVAEEQLRTALAEVQQEGGQGGQPTESTRRG